MMHGANLPTRMNVGPLQYLGDGMAPATGKLGFFIAGNQFKNFDGAARIIHGNAARNGHLR